MTGPLRVQLGINIQNVKEMLLPFTFHWPKQVTQPCFSSGKGGGGNWGGPGGRCSPPVPRGEGAGKVVHRPDDCRSIFNSQTVLSPRSLDSSSARRLNRNHHLMKEILSKTRKASKPGAAPCESSSGLVVGPPGCAKFSDGSADFVRLSTCCFL